MSIAGALPNDVLLEIFAFYLDLSQQDHSSSSSIAHGASLDPWHTLVHVCRRWRFTVFASPRYLNIRLHCTNKTPARKLLDIWPSFPIVVLCHQSLHSQLRGVLNVYAALNCPDRICEIDLGGIPIKLFKRVAAINIPLPALTSLRLSSDFDWHWQPIIKDSFLGGIAPRLRSLELKGIPFPAPQKLLLSATDLVTLRMERIPSTGYISPEEIVTCLSTLTKLEELSFGYQSYQSTSFHPHQTSQRPPVPSAVLPALTSFRFQGDCWYLEDLITRITFPVLDNFDAMFFSWGNFNSPQLFEFINRIEALDMHHRADISFHPHFVKTALSRQEGMADCGKIKFGILCNAFGWQRSYLMQLRSFLPSLPTLEHLHIHDHGSFPTSYGQFSTDDSRWQWLELLHPFTSVKRLSLSGKLALRVARALQDVSGEEVTEVLPALRDISIFGHEPSPGEQSGAILEALRKFLATLHLSGRCVSVHYYCSKEEDG